MPKLVPTIGVTVIRDDKRITPKIGKAFNFTADEVAAVTKQMPTAFRKPVNEDDTPVEQTATDATAPDGNAAATATKTPKVGKKKAAAQADSQAKEVTGKVGDQSDADEDEDEDI